MPDVVPEAVDREELVRACRTAAGDSLRSVTYLSRESYEQVYLRADLSRDADLQSFVEAEREGFAARTAYAGSELGDYRFTIRAFEAGYVTRVLDDGDGVFVTMDGAPLARFREVATAVEGVLP
ncbi:MAG: hypothetical protein ABEJ70_06785 [Halobacteriaceae archaeon]